MAYYKKLKNGKWKAEVVCLGVRKSKTLETKVKARAWAVELECSIRDGSYRTGIASSKTFGDLLREYERLVSARKKGWKKERIRIERFCREGGIADLLLRDLKTNDFALWRDERLLQVSPGTVNRELNLLSNALNVAVNEWEWLSVSPMKGLRRPAPAQHRDRLIGDDEIERILLACGYRYSEEPVLVSARCGAAFIFAIETAMRAGEIVKLTWDNVFFDRSYCFLPDTKTGLSREVALSAEAIRILKQLELGGGGSNRCFNLSSSQLDANFRKAKDRAMVDDLHFHDSRHEAITRLAKKIHVMDLARMVGIRDLKILMVYYNETAEDIARKL